jgi:hypothetical protein
METEMRIEVLAPDCFTSTKLISELHQLLAPSFEEPAAVLQRAVEKSSRLYLGKDDAGRIISFFFSDFGSHLTVAGSPLPSLYLGLSGTLQELKARGATLPLYSLCIADAFDWEASTGKKLWVWGATANTAVLRAIYKYMASISPRLDGTFAPESTRFAQALREHLRVPANPSEHPFLLRHAFSRYRHTEAEAERIRQANRADSFALVRELDVRNCEAVLFLCQTGERRPPFHTKNQVQVIRRADQSTVPSHLARQPRRERGSWCG